MMLLGLMIGLAGVQLWDCRHHQHGWLVTVLTIVAMELILLTALAVLALVWPW